MCFLPERIKYLQCSVLLDISVSMSCSPNGIIKCVPDK